MEAGCGVGLLGGWSKVNEGINWHGEPESIEREADSRISTRGSIQSRLALLLKE